MSELSSPDAFCDWRAAHLNCLLEAVEAGESYMIGRLQNDHNIARAKMVFYRYLENAYEDYKREWEKNQ